jgi:glycolate oxidase FAD binding subunit
VLAPKNAKELAEALGQAGGRKQSIALSGRSSKWLMAGPVEAAKIAITTTSLKRVLKYEPRDLTISVEAGLPWTDLVRAVAANGQMAPLDPPFASSATVGGVVAANVSGPRRRLYGAARDMVIGMKFVTLEGKLIQSGGMVVKNVAGLDMAKLMIGSFGTLAAIAVVNLKLVPAPETERSFMLAFETAADAIAARDAILSGVLQPAALDLLNPAASEALGYSGWLLALRIGGNEALCNRWEREVSKLADWASFEGAGQAELWHRIEEFTPDFLERSRDGAVVRASCTLKDLEQVAQAFAGPAIARAGTGVCYGYFSECAAAARWLKDAAGRGWKSVMEFAPENRKRSFDLWPAPGGDLELMRRVKGLFDPGNLLNRGRLYGRI